MFINGHWEKADGREFNSVNPADASIVWSGRETTPLDVDKAVKAAAKALEPWSLSAIETRISYLAKFIELVKENRSKLAEIISQEVGKPLWESDVEIGAIINKFKISLDAYWERTGIKEIDKDGQKFAVRHKPHGVIAVFGPFNFPGHLPNGHILPALLAGNTVVFKPSEFSPWTAEEFVKLWEAAGIPQGVLNLVQGSSTVGMALSQHPDIDGLFFTGSSKVGRILNQYFANLPGKILTLEMGGNNPLVVHDIDDYQAAAKMTVLSAFITAGQRCTCARRLIVPEGKSGDAFIESLISMSQSLSVGYYNQAEVFMGPVITKAQKIKLLEEQSKLLSKGARILLEMKALNGGDSGFISPGIIDVTDIHQRDDFEIFGPLLQLIRVKGQGKDLWQNLIKEANNTSYGLSAGLISNDEELYKFFYARVKAGIINWNQQLTGASSAAPFGGIGDSGNHRPSAYYAADYCAYPVASIESKNLS
jgi:succinylglutamic semialdehyde dehydrogenase